MNGSRLGWVVCAALAGAGMTRAEDYAWRTVVMGGGGFVSALVAHPTQRDVVYARTDVGGAYRWEAGTGSWRPLLDWLGPDETSFLGVESVAVDLQHPERVYLSAGTRYWNGGRSAILRSFNSGATWDVVDVTRHFRMSGNGMGRQSGERLAVDPRNSAVLLCGTRTEGLFRSVNAGSNWSRVTSLDVTTTTNGNGIAFVMFAGNAIYVAVSRAEENLFVSRDAGGTWNLVPGAPSGLLPQRAALASDGRLYVSYADGAGPHGDPTIGQLMGRGAVWCCNTVSGAWTDITPPGRPRAFSGVAVDPQHPRRVMVSTINHYVPQPWGYGDRLYLSEDAGATWRDLIGEKSVAMDDGGFPWVRGKAMHWTGCVTWDPFDSNRVFVTSGHGIFVTTNLASRPSTWTFAVRGLEETVPMDVVSVPGGPLLSVVLDYDGCVHTNVDVSPATGTHAPNMGSCTALAVPARKPQLVARAGRELQVSTDTGQTWTRVTTSPEPKAGGGWLAWSADGAVLLWGPGAGANWYRTTDRGQTWAACAGREGRARVVGDPVNAARFYQYDAASGKLSASHDGGRTFSVLSDVGRGGSTNLRTVPGCEGHLWLPLGGRGLAFSTNGGASFETNRVVTACSAVGVGRAAAGSDYDTMFLWGRVTNGVTGVYRSIDRGASWLRINDDAHEYGGLANGQFVVGDANVFGRVYLSTAGRGIIVGEAGR